MIESIIMALIGGSFIGLAASAMLYFSGRIAGISGIVGGLLAHSKTENAHVLTHRYTQVLRR